MYSVLSIGCSSWCGVFVWLAVSCLRSVVGVSCVLSCALYIVRCVFSCVLRVVCCVVYVGCSVLQLV